MNEKKLTDEEIVKAFEKGSQNHGYFTEINGKWVKYEDVFSLIRRLQKENERLRKQVDELLNGRIEPKIFQCHADTLENCPKVEQAVKDTAKEIADFLVNEIGYCGLVYLLKKRYGVEVEE